MSTSFLVLSAFVPKNSNSLLLHSLTGYLMAFAMALVVYGALMWLLERTVLCSPLENRKVWLALQWISTGWLWSQWLVQDMANIFVYLPRELNLSSMVAATLMLCFGLCVLVAIGGGPIQGVVRNKINTGDLRSATVIDFLFGCVLFWKASIAPSRSAPPGCFSGCWPGVKSPFAGDCIPLIVNRSRRFWGVMCSKLELASLSAWRWPSPFSPQGFGLKRLLWRHLGQSASMERLFGCR